MAQLFNHSFNPDDVMGAHSFGKDNLISNKRNLDFDLGDLHNDPFNPSIDFSSHGLFGQHHDFNWDNLNPSNISRGNQTNHMIKLNIFSK